MDRVERSKIGRRQESGRIDDTLMRSRSMSTKTASVRVANIKGKLGVDTRVEIATTALRLEMTKQPVKQAAPTG